MTKRWQICWPPVADAKDIQLTVWMGCIAAALWALNPGLNLLVGPFIIILETHTLADIPMLIKSLLIFIVASSIGWGIYNRIKIASLAGLILAFATLLVGLASADIKIKNTISDVL